MKRITIDDLISDCIHYLSTDLSKNNKCIKWRKNEIENIKNYLQELKTNQDLNQQGKIIRLPCKVGDTIWFIDERCYNCKDEDGDCYGCPYHYDSEKQNDKFVRNMVIKQIRIFDGSAYIVNSDVICSTTEISLNINQFNKTIFLTKEEAESKLKTLKNK